MATCRVARSGGACASPFPLTSSVRVLGFSGGAARMIEGAVSIIIAAAIVKILIRMRYLLLICRCSRQRSGEPDPSVDNTSPSYRQNAPRQFFAIDKQR